MAGSKVIIVDEDGCPVNMGGSAPANKPDQTHKIIVGVNEQIEKGFKKVIISNNKGVTVVNDGFEIGDDRRPDSLILEATELDGARGLLPEINLKGGDWQWIGLLPIDEI